MGAAFKGNEGISPKLDASNVLKSDVVNDQRQNQQQVTRRSLASTKKRPNSTEKELNNLDSHMIASWACGNNITNAAGDHKLYVDDSHYSCGTVTEDPCINGTLISPRKPALLMTVRTSPSPTTCVQSGGLVSLRLLRHFVYFSSAVLSMVLLSLVLLNIGGGDYIVEEAARLPGAMMLLRQDFLFQTSRRHHLHEHHLAVLGERVHTAEESPGRSHLVPGLPQLNTSEPRNRLSRAEQARSDLWVTPVGEVGYRQCLLNTTKKFAKKSPQHTNGYLVVNANGGLNQMRLGICDMVAIAQMINATLVVPRLDHTSFWADPSEFQDIFDVDHFIQTLEHDVPVVESLPSSLMKKEPIWKAPISWSKNSYYKNKISLLVKEGGVVYLSHTDSRLVNNGLSSSVQALRCRACYSALKFTRPIEQLGALLVHRMRSQGQPGLFVALHLRYEKDMLAFTGCSHGLTDAEGEELEEMRYGVSRWKEKEIDGEARRLEGGCPLTPRESALLLQGLGFPSSTPIYIVAGPIFGNGNLTGLQQHYPSVFTHSTLATPMELDSFQAYQNRLAGLDYIVALESDAFVYSYDGNMAKAVQGHRRFEGHRKTINPDRKNVVRLVDELDKGKITREVFEKQIQQLHRHRMGAPKWRARGDSPKLEESFYANPLPGCICPIISHTSS